VQIPAHKILIGIQKLPDNSVAVVAETLGHGALIPSTNLSFPSTATAKRACPLVLAAMGKQRSHRCGKEACELYERPAHRTRVMVQLLRQHRCFDSADVRATSHQIAVKS
jgi:hypothetical protein